MQVTQAESKVLQETEREANEDPFGSTEDEPASSASSSMASSSLTPPSIAPTPQHHPKKLKPDKHGKKSRSRAFNLEKEKPQLLQAIASSSVASTNLMNALKLLNREQLRVSEHAETVERFETCKALRRQILRYIQHVESEQWLGSLINANDSLVEALMAYEILDKSVDDDSDSEEQDWSDEEQPTRSPRPEVTGRRTGSVLKTQHRCKARPAASNDASKRAGWGRACQERRCGGRRCGGRGRR